MDQKTQLSFLINPLYAEAQNHFQKGEWDIGLEKLKKLEESYPLDHELRKLRQEMQIRARIDFYEDDDNQRIRRNRVFIYGLQLTTGWSPSIITIGVFLQLLMA